jgi:uncharacterized protein Usg
MMAPALRHLLAALSRILGFTGGQSEAGNGEPASETGTTMTGFTRNAKPYHLTTAEILYHRPDHPALLQSYIWQEYDLVPRFPALNKFLRFWETQLDGRLHSVWVAATGVVRPTELRYFGGEFTLQ